MKRRLMAMVILLMLGAVTTEVSSVKCKAGWGHYDDKCYKILQHPKSQEEAVCHCYHAVIGGVLVDILSDKEQEYINRRIFNMTSYWIGLTRTKHKLVWSSGNTPQVDYRINDTIAVKGNRRCYIMISSKDGYWREENCNNKYSFICKYTLHGKDSYQPGVNTTATCGSIRIQAHAYMYVPPINTNSKSYQLIKHNINHKYSTLEQITGSRNNKHYYSPTVVPTRVKTLFQDKISGTLKKDQEAGDHHPQRIQSRIMLYKNSSTLIPTTTSTGFTATQTPIAVFTTTPQLVKKTINHSMSRDKLPRKPSSRNASTTISISGNDQTVTHSSLKAPATFTGKSPITNWLSWNSQNITPYRTAVITGVSTGKAATTTHPSKISSFLTSKQPTTAYRNFARAGFILRKTKTFKPTTRKTSTRDFIFRKATAVDHTAATITYLFSPNPKYLKISISRSRFPSWNTLFVLTNAGSTKSELSSFEKTNPRISSTTNSILPTSRKRPRIYNNEEVSTPDMSHIYYLDQRLNISSEASHLKKFLVLMNYFLNICHSKEWEYLDMDDSVLHMVFHMDIFINHTINRGILQNEEEENFKYIDIEIEQLNAELIDNVTLRDDDDTWTVSDMQLTGNSSKNDPEGNLTVAVIVLKTPTIKLNYLSEQDENITGYILSPILSLTVFQDNSSLQISHCFKLKINTNRSIIKSFNIDDTDTLMTEKMQTFKCIYLNGLTRSWSDYGCKVIDIMATHVSCSCNHTTNFAILLQIHPFEISKVEDLALSTISYIGCTISLVAQLITITVFTFVDILSCERIYVHRNLCLAIVAAQVTFLAGIKSVENKTVCSIVALLLHYCYTAVFTWMLVEGLHLYSRVVRVFGSEKSRRIYYTTFGWGVPLLLVTISAVADWKGYGTEYNCWLSTRRETIWAFAGPALAIMMVNLVILISVVRIVMSSAKHERHGELNQVRAGVKSAFFLLPLLGLTWIFGLISVNEDMIVFQYIFAVANSLQGFFIFFFHCVLNSEVRQALLRIKQKRSLQRGGMTSSSGTPTNMRLQDKDNDRVVWGRSRKIAPLTHTTSVRTITA